MAAIKFKTEDNLDAAVREQCRNFGRRFTAGEIDLLVSEFYAEDACLVAPDAPLIQGRPGIAEALGGLRAGGVGAIELEPIEITGDESAGLEVGRARLFERAGDKTFQGARYMVVWRKYEDGWRAQADMFAMGDI